MVKTKVVFKFQKLIKETYQRCPGAACGSAERTQKGQFSLTSTEMSFYCKGVC